MVQLKQLVLYPGDNFELTFELFGMLVHLFESGFKVRVRGYIVYCHMSHLFVEVA